MFDSDIKVIGKHATYIKFLSKKTTELNKDFVGAEVFRRYIDVYIAGAVLGILKKRKADIDNTPNGDSAMIFASAVINEQSNLKFLYRMILLLDDASLSNDDRVDLAFRNDTDNEKLKAGMEVFNSYARGGIEWLYEKFTDGATTKEDYLQKIAEIVNEFKQDFSESFIES
jgi:hypothetical protein